MFDYRRASGYSGSQWSSTAPRQWSSTAPRQSSFRQTERYTYDEPPRYGTGVAARDQVRKRDDGLWTYASSGGPAPPSTLPSDWVPPGYASPFYTELSNECCYRRPQPYYGVGDDETLVRNVSPWEHVTVGDPNYGKPTAETIGKENRVHALRQAVQDGRCLCMPYKLAGPTYF